MLFKTILLLMYLISPLSLAQSPETTTPVQEVKVRIPKWKLTPRMVFWQEDIEATELGQKSNFRSQIMGLSVGVSKTILTKNKMIIPFVGADASFGTIKANGTSNGNVDQFKNQPWYGVGAITGFAFRPLGNSEIRLGVPVGFRKIQWKTARSSLDLGRDQSFTIGLSLLSATKISKKVYLIAGLTHLYLWQSTQWQAGIDYPF